MYISNFLYTSSREYNVCHMTRDFPKKNVDARASLSGKKIACRAFNSFIIV